jgi:hypothetical protein
MLAAGYSPSAVKQTLTVPFMSSSELGSDASSSSSEESDNERGTNRDLAIPSPELLSDAADNGISPSQHKLQWTKPPKGELSVSPHHEGASPPSTLGGGSSLWPQKE